MVGSFCSAKDAPHRVQADCDGVRVLTEDALETLGQLGVLLLCDDLGLGLTLSHGLAVKLERH